MKLIGSRQNSA